MRYETVSPPYHPPRQAQSIFDFYERFDRYAEMLIWWENLQRIERNQPRLNLTAIGDRREFALNYQKQEVETV